MAAGVGDTHDDLCATASFLRRARVCAAILLIIQFWLYQPPPDIPMPHARVPMAAGFVAALLLVNLLSLWATRTRTVAGLRTVAVVETAADAALTYGLVLLFTFDPHSSLWALLIIPVLEGATRASLAGALWAWIGVSLAYLGREIWGVSAYDYREFGLDGVTYVVGIIGIVAVSMGLTARSLRQRTAAHRAAKAEAELRADELQRAKSLLAHQAAHDDLTGLANRAQFLDRLTEALEPSDGAEQADQPQDTVAVLFIDLDALKAVNDELGHAAGDELLRLAAARLRHTVRSEDLVARLGGDEFTVLVHGADDPGELEAVAGRVVERFREPFSLTAGRGRATVSLGIATGQAGRDSAGRVVSAADTAMYAAKRRGGDQYVHHTDVPDPARGRRDLGVRRRTGAGPEHRPTPAHPAATVSRG